MSQPAACGLQADPASARRPAAGPPQPPARKGWSPRNQPDVPTHRQGFDGQSASPSLKPAAPRRASRPTAGRIWRRRSQFQGLQNPHALLPDGDGLQPIKRTLSNPHHFKVLFAGSAFRTSPVHVDIRPQSARRDAMLGVASGFVVNPTTNQAHPGTRVVHGAYLLLITMARL